MSVYRPELPPVPRRMLALPVRRGYPVPYFVDINPETQDYDFRIADGRKRVACVREHRCWVCGQPLGRAFAFLIGPMCAINRVSSEPPSHADCADFSARACPFLSRPDESRREDRLPAEMVAAPGVGLQRNPGVALVWITDSYQVFDAGSGRDLRVEGATVGAGQLIHLGEPIELRWYAEGRKASRAEVLASIDSGFPLLRQVAASQGPQALARLEEELAGALALVPQEAA